MDNYAVVKIAHRQYILEPDKTYTVDKFIAEPGSKVELDVVAQGNGKDFNIGAPKLDKVKVQIEVLEQGKGEKVVSKTFKAKARQRKTRGFHKQVTTFKVLSIK